LFLAVNAHAYWIWTPKSKKWINPKYAPKDSPELQFEYAKGYYDNQEYKRAIVEMRRVIKYFPRSSSAAEAQYYEGLCYEGLGKPYQAHLSYQKHIDKYPFSERREAVIEQQFKIGELYLEGKVEHKFLGIDLSLEDPAIEIFNKVVQNSPYGTYADLAQYKLGLAYMKRGYFKEAKDAFEKLLDEYPDSKWADNAKYQIATCASAASLGSPYDQSNTEDAASKFEDFIAENPDAPIVKDALKNLRELKEKEAKANYEIAQFYETQKAYQSAKIYYQDILTNYANTSWVDKAKARLDALEGKE
jgi:outer membrane protein assembly factor BamD